MPKRKKKSKRSWDLEILFSEGEGLPIIHRDYGLVLFMGGQLQILNTVLINQRC